MAIDHNNRSDIGSSDDVQLIVEDLTQDSLTNKQRITIALSGPWRLAPIVIALAAVWSFFAIQSPVFLSSVNLTNLTNQVAVSTLVALALVFVLIVRQVDLSLAALSAVGGAIAANLAVSSHWNAALAIAVALAFGIGVGLVQSAIVTVFRAPSFVVTLGGMFILEATLLWLLPLTQEVPLAGTPLQSIAGSYLAAWASYVVAAVVVLVYGGLRWTHHRARLREGLSSTLLRSTILPSAILTVCLLIPLIFVFNNYLGVPTPALIVLGVCAVMAYVAYQTPLGKYIYAIGGNPEAARRAGIPVRTITIVIFATAGCLSSLAGIVNASWQLGVSAESSDLTLLLGALAAVVIGGVSLFGGRGSPWSAIIGGLLVGSIQNGLDLINSSTSVQWTVEGIVLILAVVIDAQLSRGAPDPGIG
jgi:D-xylose transport system permease protein